MAARTKSPTICCHSATESAHHGDFESDAASSTASSSEAASPLGSTMAGGGLQPQPASGEVEMMGEDISHIDQNEHQRNIKIPYGSLDPAATVAGSALKGCGPC